MIKRLLIILMVVSFAWISAEAQGIKRVPNKKKDSTRTESSVKQEQPSENAKTAIQKPEFQKPKDEFIDRDGDGINDKMNKPRPPAIKKQKQPQPGPEQPKIVQPPPSQPKERPKEQPKKEAEKKKSKR